MTQKIELDEHSINELAKKANRSCGGCSMCCYLLYIPELEKPKRTMCPNICNGCKIYETRPQSCRNFTCEWLINPKFGDEWQPLKSKIVVFFSESNSKIFLNFHCQEDGCWKKEPYFSQIKFYARYGINNRKFETIVHEENQKIIINGM